MNNDPPTLILPGGSGFLGRYLSAYFSGRGFRVVALSRSLPPGTGAHVRLCETAPSIVTLRWDGVIRGEWARELDGAAAVVNLAGRSVNCRYNAENRREILESRIRSTRLLGEAIAACEHPPPVWINSSSATVYRHAEERPMDEATGELGTGFSVDVVRQWEAELFAAEAPRTRRVALRTALVLGRGGGVYEAFAGLVRAGLGGTMGPGTQRVSWVHLEDFARSIEWLLEHELEGPVNCAAPGPVTNHDFMREFREVLRQPFGLPAARWMLEVGALLRGTETELLLKSRWVLPGRLLGSGFVFRYPELRGALEDLSRSDG